MLINTKLLGVIAGILIAVLFMGVQYAEADEMTLMIKGENKDHDIFIAIDGDVNIIMWDALDGYSKHFDSKLKTYKSGGFSLKNPESGIIVWGHPMEDSTQYKLVILTSEGVERIVSSVVDYTPLEETEKKTTATPTARVEPKSSVGADITRYGDLPTPKRSVENPSFILSIETDRIKTLNLGEDFTQRLKVYEVRKNEPLVGANVILEISRDGFIHKSQFIKTGLGGLANFEIKYMEYPLFYPNFCYDVTITAEYDGYAAEVTDDFKILYNGVWNPSLEWVSESRWNYLPSNFSDEPRKSVFADSKCN